jgi:hypothetical protein
MILNMSGGGAGLNFKVVGGTGTPSNPKENTIWVNTNVEITSWIFSATQPTGSNGMVWFYTGTTSAAEFNALKKNGMTVYPLYAKQYDSGAWVDKSAKSYQGGEWVEWVIYIFKQNEGLKKTLTYSVRPEKVSVLNSGININGLDGVAFGMAEKIDITQHKGMKVEYIASAVSNGYNSNYDLSLVLSNTTAPNSSQAADTTRFPYRKVFTIKSSKGVLDFPFDGSGNYFPFIVGSGVATIYNWWIY